MHQVKTGVEFFTEYPMKAVMDITKEQSPLQVSVIIPVYNASTTLGQCIESILSQTPLPAEIIAVDDNSKDNSVEIVREYREITLISTGKNSGPAVARNLGAARSSSEIILFVDADVVLPEDLISRLLNDFVENREISAVQTLYHPICPAEDPVSRYQNFYYYYYAFRCNPRESAVFSTYCVGVKRETFRHLGGFDTSIPEPTVEDEEFGYHLVEEGGSILLDRSLQVEHLAEYSLKQFFRRRIRMSSAQIKNGLRKFRSRLIGRYASVKNSGTHHNPQVILSIFLVWAAVLTLLSGIIAALCGTNWWKVSIPAVSVILILTILLNSPFLNASRKLFGFVTMLKFAGMILVDMLALGGGIIKGTAQYITGKKY